MFSPFVAKKTKKKKPQGQVKDSAASTSAAGQKVKPLATPGSKSTSSSSAPSKDKTTDKKTSDKKEQVSYERKNHFAIYHRVGRLYK